MVKVFHLPFLIVFKPSFSWKDVYIRPHFFTRVFTGISPITKEVDQQWKKIIEAFPENVPLPKVTCPAEDEQKYTINKRTSKKDAKCATSKKELSERNIQATTEGPYRTIQRSWIKRTFFFCPHFQCMGKLPRNYFICPYKTAMTLLIETSLTEQQKKEIDLKT